MKKMNSYNEYYINQALGKISNQPGVLPRSGLGGIHSRKPRRGLGGIHTDTGMALPFKLESDTSDFNLTSNLSSNMSSNTSSDLSNDLSSGLSSVLSSNKLSTLATYSKKKTSIVVNFF